MGMPDPSDVLVCGGRWTMSTHVLGEGTSAIVYKGQDVATGMAAAIKRVNLQTLSAAEKKQVTQELQFLRQYRHPNLIRLLDMEKTDNLLYLVLEYAESDLFTYLNRTGPLPEPQGRYIFRQIVDAVAYMHGNRIAHRDLKLENFVVTADGRVKIIDFGLSARVTPQHKLGDMCGSMAYSPPEIVMHVPYDGTAADMWSLGIVLYTLLLGGFPFYAQDPALMKDQITHGKLRFPKWLSLSARQLIVAMLHRHPEHRACIYDVQDHPWLAPSPSPSPPPSIGDDPSAMDLSADPDRGPSDSDRDSLGQNDSAGSAGLFLMD